MLKPWYLKIHGWVAVVFSIPLAILVFTGLVLSFEPIVQYSGIEPGTLNAEEISGYLKKYDPDGKARALTHRAYENTLIIDGVGPEGEVEIDLLTRAPAIEDGSWAWSEFFRANRRLHEHVTIANVDLTIVSTYVMLGIILLGILMGLPRIRNTVGGWHKAVSWYLLPFLIISPLTGAFMAGGLTLNFSTATPLPKSEPLPIAEAVKIIGASHDLSNLIWLRQRGGRQMVRLWDGQEARAYAVTKAGLQPLPRNFTRLIHEGNFLGIWSGMMKVITSLGFALLMGTGLWLFVTKQIRKYQNRKARSQQSGPVAAE